MALPEREVFTFTWRIERFSFCPQAIGQEIESPIFAVDILNKSEWLMSLYPRGYEKNNENLIGFFLRRMGDYDEKTAFHFAITLLTATGKEFTQRVVLESPVFEDYAEYGGYFSRDVILDLANGLLPNDTLTLKCEMWKTADGSTDGDLPHAEDGASEASIEDSDLFRQIRASVARDDALNFRTQFGHNQLTAVTRIEVGKKSILWPVRRFGELRPNKKLSISVPTSMKTAPSFFLTLYLREGNTVDQHVQIEIQRDPIGSEGNCFVKCKIVAFDATNRDRCVSEDEHLFTPNTENDVWKFPEFIDAEKFKRNKCFSSSRDVVYLRCEFAFSRPEDVSHVEKTNTAPGFNEIPLSISNNSIGSLFKEMCDTDKFSDVTIRTDDHEFKAHKIVLSAQSPVFKAMFENDMLEKQSGIVDIKDIHKDTFASMLHFMYGEDLELDIQVDAEELYSAADKYEILPLKWLCSDFLKLNLSVSNVCSVLTLADLHQDEELMDEVKHFIHSRAAEIFHSLTWNDFLQNNCKLAGEIMLDMLKNLNL